MTSSGAPATTAGASETVDESRPVEMNTRGSASQPSTSLHSTEQPRSSRPTARPEAAGALPTATTESTGAVEPTETPEPAFSTSQPTTLPAVMSRQQSAALGPATETGAVTPASTSGPSLQITLMVTSTGSRHPYRIDEKYLRSRDTVAQTGDGTFDPRMISGYKLRELIWTDWRNEWEPRPASPGSIRLIFMGQLVDDKQTLSDFRIKLNEPNVIHMSVKPADFGEDDEAGAAKGAKSSSIRQRDGGDGGAGCRCVIL